MTDALIVFGGRMLITAVVFFVVLLGLIELGRVNNHSLDWITPGLIALQIAGVVGYKVVYKKYRP